MEHAYVEHIQPAIKWYIENISPKRARVVQGFAGDCTGIIIDCSQRNPHAAGKYS